MIPYARQSINQHDIDAVIKVLRSNFLTQGSTVPAFEQALCNYCGAKNAVAVCNATAALHLACLALEVGKGDSVWTSPNTYVASANCALYCGAKIDFVDIDPQSYNLCVKKLQAKLKIAQLQNTLPKVLITVHFAGQSCDMKEIKKLSKQYGFAIIEDASHAIGGEYLGKKIGCCEYSDVAIFSFHPVKIMTTGEGGAALSNNVKLIKKIELLKNAGITKNPDLMTEAAHGDWYYQQLELGYNYRMSDIHAALGLSQLKRLDVFIKRRREIAKGYSQQLKNLPLQLPIEHEDATSSWHLYVIRLKLAKIDLSQKEVFNALRNSGIGVQTHYIPVHTQPFYQKMGFKIADFPVSECYYQEAISLPIYFDLSSEQINKVISTLKKLLVTK